MLDIADKVASIVSALLGIVGLVLTVHGARARRRDRRIQQTIPGITVQQSHPAPAAPHPQPPPPPTLYVPPRGWQPPPGYLPPRERPYTGGPPSPGSEPPPFAGEPADEDLEPEADSPPPAMPTPLYGAIPAGPAARDRAWALPAGIGLLAVAAGLAAFAALV